VAEKVTTHCKAFRILAQTIKPMKEVNLELLQLLEFLLESVQCYFRSEWYHEFIDLINSISHIFVNYLEQFPTQEQRLLWFLVKYTDVEERAIEVVMEQLPVTSLLMDYLSS